MPPPVIITFILECLSDCFVEIYSSVAEPRRSMFDEAEASSDAQGNLDYRVQGLAPGENVSLGNGLTFGQNCCMIVLDGGGKCEK